jgi:hypothetical protein
VSSISGIYIGGRLSRSGSENRHKIKTNKVYSLTTDERWGVVCS